MLRGKVEGPLLPDLADIDPSPKLFRLLTRQVIKASHDATIAGDLDSLRRLKEYSQIIAMLSKSYQPWSEVQKSMEEFQSLVEYHEQIDKRSLKEGILATQQESRSSIAQSLATDTESEAQIFPASSKV